MGDTVTGENLNSLDSIRNLLNVPDLQQNIIEYLTDIIDQRADKAQPAKGRRRRRG